METRDMSNTTLANSQSAVGCDSVGRGHILKWRIRPQSGTLRKRTQQVVGTVPPTVARTALPSIGLISSAQPKITRSGASRSSSTPKEYTPQHLRAALRPCNQITDVIYAQVTK